MVETGMLTYCDGINGAMACSLRRLCRGVRPTTEQEEVMKFCLMFPHDGPVHFEEER